jgi:general secretion pathway protein A
MTYMNAGDELRYLNFFGLKDNPFPVVPDEESFYCSENIEQIIMELVYGITTGKGFMVLTGDVGLGKTTISRVIIGILEEKGIASSLVLQTACQGIDLLREINRDFGIDIKSSDTEAYGFGDQMKHLNDFLVQQNLDGKNCAIIIDDAQNLNTESLELIRMISNLETGKHKLVQILLVGQPELMDKLNTKSLRPLKSRIIIQKEAIPMNREELKGYIQFKLNHAGNTGQLVVYQSAIRRIYQITRGNFRHCNILLDRCLNVAFLLDTKQIAPKIVKKAYEDMQGNKGPIAKRTYALGFIMLLLLLVTGGAYVYNLEVRDSYETSIDAGNIQENKGLNILDDRINSGVNPANALPVAETSISEKAVFVDSAGRHSIKPLAIKLFLEFYGLSDFEAAFLAALESNQLAGAARLILDKTGYQLIDMQEVPEYIRKQYGILSYPSPLDGRDRHVLFWLPSILIDKFYYSYSGQEIYVLQEIMRKMNLYNADLDGYVGKNLMKGIVEFQKRSDLPVTGYPDAKTIFLIWHNEGKV